MKLSYLLFLPLILSLNACKFSDVTSVDIDKYSATGQCIIGCIESHGTEAPDEIQLVETP
jgi:hypothetical protein